MDGIPKTNKKLRKVEPLIGIGELKERFLYGIEIKDDSGKPLPDSAYQSYINTAVGQLENFLDISIIEEDNSEEPEFHDFYRNEYQGWGHILLNNIPIIEIDKIEFVYAKDESGQYTSVLEIPKAWQRIDKHSGIIRFVPSAQFPSNLSMSPSGVFSPELFTRYSHLPNMWRISYKYGFEPGKIPVLVNAAIGLMAAIFALNIGGDLVIGAGVASKSLGLSGLSESVNTTSSAENHAYSAKVKEYQRLLYGPAATSPERGILRQLKDYFQGYSIQSI